MMDIATPTTCLTLLLALWLPLSVSAASEIITSHAITMHGSPKYGADFEGFDYTSYKALKGGQITLHAIGTFNTFNPFIPKGNVAVGIGMIYDTLMAQAGDEPFTLYGLVAEKVEYPLDRSWIIFHLNPNARFHDGLPITAEDVVFSFNIRLEKGDPTFRFYYAGVTKVEALDSQRVKFSFSDDNNRELPLIVAQLQIFPKHYWQGRAFDKSSMEIPLGSGPYKIGMVDQGRSLTYERVKDYWGAELAVNRGLYNFDRITYDYYRDENISLEALKAQEYDLRRERMSKMWATAYTGDAIDNGRLKLLEITHENPSGMQAFIFNLRRDMFKNPKLREAISYAFDFEWINKALFYNAYKRINSYFANSELASSGLPSGRELEILEAYRDQLPLEVFTTHYQPPASSGEGHNRPNLRKAKKILDEAGYKIISNQLVDPDTGEPVRFEILQYDVLFERISNPFIQGLKKLGIQAHLRIVDTSQYINRIRQFDFDMIVHVIGQSLSPGNEQRDFWHSEAADTPSSRNLIGIKNPVIDDLVEKLINAETREELVYLCRALDRVLLHQHYVIPHWYINYHRLAFWNKFSRPEIAPKYDGNFSLGLMTWWYAPQKAARLESSETLATDQTD